MTIEREEWYLAARHPKDWIGIGDTQAETGPPERAVGRPADNFTLKEQKDPLDLSADRSTRMTRAVGNMTAWLGSFPAIFLSVLVVAVWFVGIFFVNNGFTNTNYQLIINTGTTIITFWMVFIIQNTQNRDGKAIQTKLDAQSHALRLICDKFGLSPDALGELAGLEDAPEQIIIKEQERVRQVALKGVTNCDLGGAALDLHGRR